MNAAALAGAACAILLWPNEPPAFASIAAIICLGVTPGQQRSRAIQLIGGVCSASQSRPCCLSCRLEERVAPSNFDDVKTTWDAVEVAYFTSVATWNYFTAPFLFTYAGVTAEEIEPWEEDGATWRRLAVTFPPGIANHNPDQVFYYDEHFMLRRLDNSPDVTGNPRLAHYTHDPKTFDGFVFPTRRRDHLHDEAGHADQSFALITLDIECVTVHRNDLRRSR